MIRVFPPPTPGSDNSLRAELDAERKSIGARVWDLPDTQILRPELEAALADELVNRFWHPALVLGEPTTDQEVQETTVQDTDPRYLGPSQMPRPRKVGVFVVHLPLIDGEREWLLHWPPGSFPALSERVTYDPSRKEVVLRVFDDPRSDTSGAASRQFLDAQLALLRRLVDATNAALDTWNKELPGFCRDVIARERERREAQVNRQRALGPPVRPRSEAPVPYPLPRRRAQRVQFSANELAEVRGRPLLPSDDFTEVLNQLQRAAAFFREHPRAVLADEETRRDLVLAI